MDASGVPRGVYRLYPLGTITVTPNCRIWFSGSWETKLELGERLYRPPSPDNDNRYDVYVSLKFNPPIPPTPAEIAANDRWSLDINAPYSVLCRPDHLRQAAAGRPFQRSKASMSCLNALDALVSERRARYGRWLRIAHHEITSPVL